MAEAKIKYALMDLLKAEARLEEAQRNVEKIRRAIKKEQEKSDEPTEEEIELTFNRVLSFIRDQLIESGIDKTPGSVRAWISFDKYYALEATPRNKRLARAVLKKVLKNGITAKLNERYVRDETPEQSGSAIDIVVSW